MRILTAIPLGRAEILVEAFEGQAAHEHVLQESYLPRLRQPRWQGWGKGAGASLGGQRRHWGRGKLNGFSFMD